MPDDSWKPMLDYMAELDRANAREARIWTIIAAIFGGGTIGMIIALVTGVP